MQMTFRWFGSEKDTVTLNKLSKSRMLSALFLLCTIYLRAKRGSLTTL